MAFTEGFTQICLAVSSDGVNTMVVPPEGFDFARNDGVGCYSAAEDQGRGSTWAIFGMGGTFREPLAFAFRAGPSYLRSDGSPASSARPGRDGGHDRFRPSG